VNKIKDTALEVSEEGELNGGSKGKTEQEDLVECVQRLGDRGPITLKIKIEEVRLRLDIEKGENDLVDMLM
jgi:hypothetical protein